FLDGQLWYSFDHYDLVNPIVRNQNRIGSSSLQNYSNVTLDEFRIYNRMLSLTEIQTLSNSYTCTGVVSVEKASSNSHISLYPNPATDQVKVELSDPTIQILSTEVFDVTGKQVFVGKNEIISINQLISGIYLVKVQTTAGQFVSRLQKQ
ncbi:MAG: T9SS type A sorting domain-containing protein, partial [Bacteroidia bacterium]|nr:T9SS type A sorting domain-containing protein [Bacteroidia bacterium]